METIKLDLIPGKKMPSLHASQYDDGREHGIDLFENGVVYKLDGTETLTINERKGDDCICSLDIENTFTGSNHIVFASTEQMCAVWGNNICELVIAKGEKTLGTLNFILEIEPSPTEGGIESESEISNLERQITEITEQVIGDDYYTAEETDDAIATATEGKADTTYVNTKLAKKADKTDTYTKSQVDTIANRKMNSANPTGTGSIAVGSNMLNIGSNSQTFGSNTKALGNNSFATGENNQASVANQFVFGKYNQYSFGNLVEIVGNGTSESNRSNARTLDWNGNETLAGDLTFNGNKSLTSEISRLDGRIDNLPAPMIFKGTLGVGGTIQSLPTASASNEGFTYKVITDGTYAGQTAKVGDVFTSNGSAWVYIPSGDEDNDTWRAIKVNGVEKLGNGISSGAVDFEDTANVKFEFDANGNKIKAKLDGIYTESDVDDLLDDKADADNTYTKEQVDDIVYNILPDDTASGSVANFETDLALPIKSLEIDVNAKQDLHGYDYPWIAGGGKNLLKTSGLSLIPPSNTAFSNATKRTFSPNSFCLGLTSNNYYQDNKVTQYLVEENNISVTSSANAYAVIIPITNLESGETYTLSASSSQGKMSVGFWEEDGTFISFAPEVTSGVLSFSVPANAFYVGLSFNPQTNDVQATFTNIQLEKGSTATSWTPYENICPISGWSEINLYKLGGNFFNKNTVENGKLINASGNEVSYADWNTSDFIPVVEGASYYLYGLTTHPNTNQDNFELFNASKVKVGYANVKTNEQPYVIPSGVAYIKCCVKNQDIDTAQLGVSVNASFVPYNPTLDKYVINLGGTYYGGHFTQDKDGHRQFVALCGYGDLAQDYSWQTHQNGFWYATKVAEMQRCDSTVVPNIKAERYTPKTAKYIYSHGSEYGLFGVNGGLLYITDSVSPGGKYVYDLATPIIIDLPDGEPIATLVGTNNIYADTGDTSVVFKDSVNGYVEKKIANVQALALNT